MPTCTVYPSFFADPLQRTRHPKSSTNRAAVSSVTVTLTCSRWAVIVMQAVSLSRVMLGSRESSSDRVDPFLAIGDVAERTGLAVSAIRFYENKGLITSTQAPSGHRRFRRSMIRRLSFVLISQHLGYSLDEIKAQLDRLPEGSRATSRRASRVSSCCAASSTIASGAAVCRSPHAASGTRATPRPNSVRDRASCSATPPTTCPPTADP